MQQHAQRCLAILVYENICYHSLKLMKSMGYAQYNPPLFLTRNPVVYGTWRPHKYCITRVLQKIFAFIYLFFLWLTDFGRCSAQPSEPHLYGV